MAPSEKVGSWLSENKSAEAYDSGSASEAESSKDAVNGNGSKEKREEVDWSDVLGRIRWAVADKSPKRRQAFIGRNLYVNEDCELLVAWDVNLGPDNSSPC